MGKILGIRDTFTRPFSVFLFFSFFLSFFFFLRTGASLVAQMVKESACNAEELGWISGLGRSPGEGNGCSFQYLSGEFHGQRSLMGYSPCCHKESDTIEKLTFSLFLSPLVYITSRR